MCQVHKRWSNADEQDGHSPCVHNDFLKQKVDPMVLYSIGV